MESLKLLRVVYAGIYKTFEICEIIFLFRHFINDKLFFSTLNLRIKFNSRKKLSVYSRLIDEDLRRSKPVFHKRGIYCIRSKSNFKNPFEVQNAVHILSH